MKYKSKTTKVARLIIICFLLFLTQRCSDEASGTTGGKSTNKSNTQLMINATNSKTQLAESKGRNIAYRFIGKGEPIILCQRFRGNLDDWDPGFLDELAKSYTVITFDYSGFGSSTGSPHTDMAGFASDVIDLADVLQIKRFIIGGWSFGGWVAQIITTEFVDRVSQTILVGTKPPGNVQYQFEDIFKQTAYKPANDFSDEIILFFEPTSELSRSTAKESHDRIAGRTTDKDVPIKLDQLSFYGKGGEDYVKDPYKARQKLTTTKIPILVISGDHEICFPPENWFELNRKLPTTQIVVFLRQDMVRIISILKW